MRHMIRTSRKEAGFSLVELLVAMGVGSIVMALIVTAYWSQTQTNKTQQVTVDMQQNIRSAMFFIQQDVMMAGFSDDPSNPAAGDFLVASPTTMRFSYAEPTYEEDNIDNDNDGDVDEEGEKDGIDNNGDGDTDETNELETIEYALLGDGLQRSLLEIDNGFNPRIQEIIANNIQNIEFFYTLDDGSTATTVAGTDLDNIRRVGISILAETEFETSGYTDTQVFTTMSGVNWGPFLDHRRREMVTTNVLCRNMLR